jgi:hypothetical protein
MSSLTQGCAARHRRLEALIRQVGRFVLVDYGLPNLGSCATPVVPELGWGRWAENPLGEVVAGLHSIHDSTNTLVRDTNRSSRRSGPPSKGFPFPSG